MNYLSTNREAVFRNGYDPSNATFTNYNYRPNNVDKWDRTQSRVTDGYTIRPKGISIAYPQPYETGLCVTPNERKQMGFDLQNRKGVYSDVSVPNGATPFPYEWGLPPKPIGAEPLVTLPPPYGMGAKTVRDWVIRNMEFDSKSKK